MFGFGFSSIMGAFQAIGYLKHGETSLVSSSAEGGFLIVIFPWESSSLL